MAFSRASMFTIILLTVAGSLVAASVFSNPTSSGGVIDPFLVGGGTGGDGKGGDPPVKHPIPACAYDTHAAAGADACPGECGPGKCCDYILDSAGKATKNCTCKSSANPCTDPKKCSVCMIYAEAGGSTINDDCMKAVACVIQNRVNDDKTYPGIANACDAVSQPGQFDAYKCVCNNQSKNQKYCKCCNGTVTNPAELAEIATATSIVNNLNCTGFKANTYNNTGMNSWAAQHPERCTRVSPPSTMNCPTFDFYVCKRP